MKRVSLFLTLVLAFHLCSYPWGKLGHAVINQHAVDLMPDDVRPFFQSFKDSLKALGVEPDLWRVKDKSLRPWHYINLDRLDVFPFRRIPHKRSEAEKRFGKQATKKAGLLPWAVEEHYTRLVTGFRKGTWRHVRNDLIGLAHYIGDGHQPLHVTRNYDGQETGNNGIHQRYEIDLTDRVFTRDFSLPSRLLISPSRRIAYLNRRSFDFMIQTYALSTIILRSDTECFAKHGKYGQAYYDDLEKGIGKDLRAQIARAASQVAAYWYSAWLEAGKPSLQVRQP